MKNKRFKNDPDSGNYTFYTSRPGIYNGLQLELYVGEPSSIYSFGSESGAHIIINNETSFTSIFEGETKIKTNLISIII